MNKEYTDKQLEVINIKHGYNMVLAGPGCGKTDILAERIARAYENDGVDLSDMLCLTFTNRAARGMFERIRSRLGNDAVDLFVGNIHRFCSHFLFEESASGVTGETSIMDEDDTNEILTSEIPDKEIKDLIGYREEDGYYGKLVDLNWDIVNCFFGIDEHPSGSTGKIKIPRAENIIQAVKHRITDIQHLMYQVLNNHPREDYYRREYLEDYLLTGGFGLESYFVDTCHAIRNNEISEEDADYKEKTLLLAYRYQIYKENNGLIDFDDLLLYTYDAYYKDEAKEYKRYKWIQIDEIQDLSHFQLSLVDLLTHKVSDFVVLYLGDEQQAIYSFMGASLNSLNYLKERCEHIYRLDKNFRSPKYLLDIYNEYAVNELHVDKDFLPEPKDNLKADFYDVCIHAYENENEETERVYEAVLPFLRGEEHQDERTALLVPWNSDANKISERLKKDKISHFKISGLDSFQTVHMKTLMAHFNAVNNDFNLIAWSRILKQTYAVDTYKQGRRLIADMRKIGMCPSDLLRYNGTYLSTFVNQFDNEEIVLFDTETTGIDVFNDDIVQIAAYKIKGGEIVPNSFFNIIIATEKEIPPMLGKIENPLLDIYNKTKDKYTHQKGLSLFMDYIGNAILMGHNVNYDYNILKYNLQRYCGYNFDSYNAITIDTLKLAHLVSPKQRKYKLGYLIEKLCLAPSDDQGLNYHQADEDIKATWELAKYCRLQADNLLTKQKAFLEEKRTKMAIEELTTMGYKDCYYHTKENLYILISDRDGYALTNEMRYISNELKEICEFTLVDSFNSIVDFLNADVISKPNPEPNALASHFANHLMDLSTYREADLCSSSTFKEKLFVSTVHKAKGLEFENVIVMRCVDGRYPHFAHYTYDQIEEDKRLFYVAISRAMNKLIVSAMSSRITPFIDSIMHNFTFRYKLYSNNGIVVLIEIGAEKFKISYSSNDRVLSRVYNIHNVYDNGAIKNQKDLKHFIEVSFTRDDILGSIDSELKSLGGYLIN